MEEREAPRMPLWVVHVLAALIILAAMGCIVALAILGVAVAT